MSQKHLQFVNGQAKCNYHFKHYLLYTLNACKHTEVQKHLLQSSPLQIRGRFFLIFFFFPFSLTALKDFITTCYHQLVFPVYSKYHSMYASTAKHFLLFLASVSIYCSTNKKLCQKTQIKRWVHSTGRYRTSSEVRKSNRVLKRINVLF